MKCRYCNKEINNAGALALHEKRCKLNPNREIVKAWNTGLAYKLDTISKKPQEKKYCPYCNREFSNAGALAGHEPYCKLNPNRTHRKVSIHAHACKGMLSWNKGLTAETDDRVKRQRDSLRKSILENGAKSHPQTAETRKKISETMKARGHGGYRHGSGRGKKGWYKGIFCDSSWELAFVLWCEINKKEFYRAKETFQYKYKGKIRKYLPDFKYKCKDNIWRYLEVKGFSSSQWLAKKKQFPYDLIIVGRKIMNKHILPKVCEIYGENYISLYEKKK